MATVAALNALADAVSTGPIAADARDRRAAMSLRVAMTTCCTRRAACTSPSADAEAVRDVSFTIAAGESVGLVGESGSGKTLTCRSVLGVLPPGVRGHRRLESTLGGDRADRAAAGAAGPRVRGTRLGAVFQDPASYLNPSLTVGRQLAEQLRRTRRLSRGRAARPAAIELLRAVGLRDPRRRVPAVPARAVRRHAAAGPDRDRGRRRTAAARRRRGDHRARRRRPGRDARPARRACAERTGWRCCWSATTSRSSPRSATGCRAVRRRDRRVRPDRGGASRTRGTRTPRRCCGSRRSATGSGATSTSSPGRRRRPGRRRPAAGSRRGARTRVDACRTGTIAVTDGGAMRPGVEQLELAGVAA